MSKSLNEATLIGHVGKDPEGGTARNGEQWAKFSLATSKQWTDKGSGEQKEVTAWHQCVVWGKLSEVAMKYVTKGLKVYVKGEIVYRDVETDGVKKYYTDIRVFDLIMLGEKPKSGEQGSSASAAKRRPPPPADSQEEDDGLPFNSGAAA